MRSLVFALVVLAGCYSPKITNGGLVCSTKSPSCPSGYSCAGDNHCWKNGTGPEGVPDMSSGDTSGTAKDLGDASTDCGGCDGGYCNGTACTPYLTLSVTNGSTGSATIVSEDTHINCGALCSYDKYKVGDVVTLHPGPNTGVVFNGWSGACSGTGVCTITMTQDTMVTSTYSVVLTLVVNDTDGCPHADFSASATATPTGGTPCTLQNATKAAPSKTCTYSYTPGTLVTVDATPFSGNTFDSPPIDGCAGYSITSGTLTCSETLNAAQTVNIYVCNNT